MQPLTAQRAEALRLLESGEAISIRDAARKVGVSHQSVRVWLGNLPSEKSHTTPAHVEDGLDIVRERLLRKVAARLYREADDAPWSELRSGFIAYGIADDKLEHRGAGGATAIANASAGVIIVERSTPRQGA